MPSLRVARIAMIEFFHDGANVHPFDPGTITDPESIAGPLYPFGGIVDRDIPLDQLTGADGVTNHTGQFIADRNLMNYMIESIFRSDQNMLDNVVKYIAPMIHQYPAIAVGVVNGLFGGQVSREGWLLVGGRGEVD